MAPAASARSCTPAAVQAGQGCNGSAVVLPPAKGCGRDSGGCRVLGELGGVGAHWSIWGTCMQGRDWYK